MTLCHSGTVIVSDEVVDETSEHGIGLAVPFDGSLTTNTIV